MYARRKQFVDKKKKKKTVKKCLYRFIAIQIYPQIWLSVESALYSYQLKPEAGTDQVSQYGKKLPQHCFIAQTQSGGQWAYY